MKKTLIDLFENSVKQFPDNPFLWEKTKDKFEPTSCRWSAARWRKHMLRASISYTPPKGRIR